MKKTDIVLSVGLAAIVCLISACSNSSSEDIRTSGIWAEFSVESSDGSTARATAVFRTGGPTSNNFVDLSGGDRVAVNGQTMSRQSILGIITYSKVVTYEAGGIYAFDFTREGEGTYTSTVVLPEGFNITAPADDSIHTIGMDLTVIWTTGASSTDDMFVMLNKTFLVPPDPTDRFAFNFKSTNFDAGQVTFSGTETTVSPQVSSINGTLSASRKRNGTLNPAFRGGDAFGGQRREVDFTLED